MALAFLARHASPKILVVCKPNIKTLVVLLFGCFINFNFLIFSALIFPFGSSTNCADV